WVWPVRGESQARTQTSRTWRTASRQKPAPALVGGVPVWGPLRTTVTVQQCEALPRKGAPEREREAVEAAHAHKPRRADGASGKRGGWGGRSAPAGRGGAAPAAGGGSVPGGRSRGGGGRPSPPGRGGAPRLGSSGCTAAAPPPQPSTRPPRCVRFVRFGAPI